MNIIPLGRSPLKVLNTKPPPNTSENDALQLVSKEEGNFTLNPSSNGSSNKIERMISSESHSLIDSQYNSPNFAMMKPADLNMKDQDVDNQILNSDTASGSDSDNIDDVNKKLIEQLRSNVEALNEQIFNLEQRLKHAQTELEEQQATEQLLRNKNEDLSDHIEKLKLNVFQKDQDVEEMKKEVEWCEKYKQAVQLQEEQLNHQIIKMNKQRQQMESILEQQKQEVYAKEMQQREKDLQHKQQITQLTIQIEQLKNQLQEINTKKQKKGEKSGRSTQKTFNRNTQNLNNQFDMPDNKIKNTNIIENQQILQQQIQNQKDQSQNDIEQNNDVNKGIQDNREMIKRNNQQNDQDILDYLKREQEQRECVYRDDIEILKQEVTRLKQNNLEKQKNLDAQQQAEMLAYKYIIENRQYQNPLDELKKNLYQEKMKQSYNIGCYDPLLRFNIQGKTNYPTSIGMGLSQETLTKYHSQRNSMDQTSSLSHKNSSLQSIVGAGQQNIGNGQPTNNNISNNLQGQYSSGDIGRYMDHKQGNYTDRQQHSLQSKNTTDTLKQMNSNSGLINNKLLLQTSLANLQTQSINSQIYNSNPNFSRSQMQPYTQAVSTQSHNTPTKDKLQMYNTMKNQQQSNNQSYLSDNRPISGNDAVRQVSELLEQSRALERSRVQQAQYAQANNQTSSQKLQMQLSNQQIQMQYQALQNQLNGNPMKTQMSNNNGNPLQSQQMAVNPMQSQQMMGGVSPIAKNQMGGNSIQQNQFGSNQQQQQSTTSTGELKQSITNTAQQIQQLAPQKMQPRQNTPRQQAPLTESQAAQNKLDQDFYKIDEPWKRKIHNMDEPIKLDQKMQVAGTTGPIDPISNAAYLNSKGQQVGVEGQKE